ncbi:HEXXH motif-containing putative peptide modification protein [Streptomyces sp. NPDC001544]|uniref:aKG-HExxH-type peptide beta-hydroxylase n=1 Tax=Streptomyces sp. NPDC001544 TaxID=3364584 RepID=UPI00367AEF41
MLPSLPDHALTELGRTGGSPETLALLARDQDTRRLLVLRAVLDGATASPACSPGARQRLREDWALLEEAEAARTGPRGRAPSTAGPSGPAVRTGLLQPLLGSWAQRVLHTLEAADGDPRGQRDLAAGLDHFGAVTAAIAARAGTPFAVRLTAHAGTLVLPSVGALHTDDPGPTPVDTVCRGGRLTLRRPGAADVVVHLEDGVGAWSGSRAWTSAYALPGLLPGTGPVPLDDLDPYRTVHGGPHYYGLSGPVTLDDAARKHWLQAWTGTATALRLGGEGRLTEAAALLRCLVPLAAPPGQSPDGRSHGACSATRPEAFGAVLSSTPPNATAFATTLVHELQHAKLAVLGMMVTLHHSDGRARYFAPWRPEPRPYEGLLQGAYAHLALADYFQRRALGEADAARRDEAWGRFAGYHAKVTAALPALVGSDDLTPRGRQFVEVMVDTHERMAAITVPRAHVVRAREYVRAARRLWVQRHAVDVRRSRE